MEKEFIPYQQTTELKQLGFDKPCFAVYEDKKWQLVEVKNSISYELCLKTDTFPVPTFSQAFRWFREKYNLRAFIGFRPNTKQFDYHIYDMSLSGKEYVKQRTMEEFNKDPKVGTYEEAELECLIKLIEIIES